MDKREHFVTGKPQIKIFDEENDIEDADLEELEETDPVKANEIKHKKEIDELKKQKREIEQKIRALKTEGFQEKGIARILKDERKESWRLSVLTEYLAATGWARDYSVKRERWNPIMETKTTEEMIVKIDQLILSLKGLSKQISK